MKLPNEVLARLADSDLSRIMYVVIHHTDDVDQDQDVTDINREHIGSGMFSAIAYNFVIQGDGAIQVGRPISKMNAANHGLNAVSVSIAFEGDFQPGTPNYNGEVPGEQQLHSAVTIINEWLKPKLPALHYLIGHSDVARIDGTPDDATACPGDLLRVRLPELRVATNLSAR